MARIYGAHESGSRTFDVYRRNLSVPTAVVTSSGDTSDKCNGPVTTRLRPEERPRL
ncbi:hypothetical protein BIW11_04135 [Tropilaelaps mercedesae]|uniref:Uncharacterized protein n=1 Tax=Tropilaelaps mercedesae TaxID=418985 RepID=A0A1V9XAX9_9ACAR|nr:hypothetical protein BIW11_04135 [Tropilaelaps mercedesae]